MRKKEQCAICKKPISAQGKWSHMLSHERRGEVVTTANGKLPEEFSAVGYLTSALTELDKQLEGVNDAMLAINGLTTKRAALQGQRDILANAIHALADEAGHAAIASDYYGSQYSGGSFKPEGQ